MVKKTYSITKTLDQYVKSCVDTGEYASDSEYLRELIRRGQEESREIAYIRSKLIKAEQSGYSAKDRKQILAEIKESAKRNGQL